VLQFGTAIAGVREGAAITARTHLLVIVDVLALGGGGKSLWLFGAIAIAVLLAR
jgi:hypothetical protein